MKIVKNFTFPAIFLAAMCIFLQSCSGSENGSWNARLPVNSTIMRAQTPVILSSVEVDETDDTIKNIIAAPVLLYGDDRDITQPVDMTTAALISEEEAYILINKEANKYGINFTYRGLKIENILVPNIEVEKADYGIISKFMEPVPGDLLLGGYDPENSIAYEFISAVDMASWKGASTYDFRSAAIQIRNSLLKKNGEFITAVFYNPIITITEKENERIRRNEPIKKIKEDLKNKAMSDLREQVIYFFEWLAMRGNI